MQHRESKHTLIPSPAGSGPGFIDESDAVISARLYLQELFNASKFDEIARIPSITLVAPASSRPQGENCFAYLATQTGLSIASIIEGRGQRSPGSGGDLAHYHWQGTLTHVGYVEHNGLVVSKWGSDGHVFEHPPLLVPPSYGRPTYVRVLLQ